LEGRAGQDHDGGRNPTERHRSLPRRHRCHPQSPGDHPTQAVINHCADLELCSPLRIKRFEEDKKIKKPFTVEWLDAFCAHARPLNVALAMTMFGTACRINEARRLD
jgi:hypothetical protein